MTSDIGQIYCFKPLQKRRLLLLSTQCCRDGGWLMTAECDEAGNISFNYIMNFRGWTTVNILFLKQLWGSWGTSISWNLRRWCGRKRLGKAEWNCSARWLCGKTKQDKQLWWGAMVRFPCYDNDLIPTEHMLTWEELDSGWTFWFFVMGVWHMGGSKEMIEDAAEEHLIWGNSISDSWNECEADARHRIVSIST